MDGDLEESKQKSSKFKEKNFDKSFEKRFFLKVTTSFKIYFPEILMILKTILF